MEDARFQPRSATATAAACFCLIAGWFFAFLPFSRGAATQQLLLVLKPAAGGASAFTKVQTKEATGGSGTVTSITMTSTLTAGTLLAAAVIWEGSGSITAVTETTGSGAFTSTTAAATGGNGKIQWWYRLVATGGGTGISLTNTGTVTDQRIEALEFSYGGTATKVDDNRGASDGTAALSTGNVTNSGTFRLNIAGAGRYEPGTYSSLVIGATGADLEPDTWGTNCGTGFTTGNLSAQAATITWTGAIATAVSVVCFAAN